MVIGITGGIGTGKTTVLNILTKFGFHTINSDLVAHELYKRGTSCYKMILNEFGDAILDNILNIDRKKLAEIVFRDNGKMNKLNEIVHPEVINVIEKEIKSLKDNNITNIAVEAIVPVEAFKNICDEIWVIASADEDILKRVTKRDDIENTKVMDRIKAQSVIDYCKIADKILINDKDIIELTKQVEQNLKNSTEP